jgi:hypothetical protein
MSFSEKPAAFQLNRLGFCFGARCRLFSAATASRPNVHAAVEFRSGLEKSEETVLILLKEKGVNPLL